jgi:hypothetical protein
VRSAVEGTKRKIIANVKPSAGQPWSFGTRWDPSRRLTRAKPYRCSDQRGLGDAAVPQRVTGVMMRRTRQHDALHDADGGPIGPVEWFLDRLRPPDPSRASHHSTLDTARSREAVAGSTARASTVEHAVRLQRTGQKTGGGRASTRARKNMEVRIHHQQRRRRYRRHRGRPCRPLRSDRGSVR